MTGHEFIWDGRGNRGEDARYSVISGRAASDPALGALHFRILAHAGRFNQRKGWTRLSQTELAILFGYRRQQVNKAIQELVELEYLEKRSQEESGESFCFYRPRIDEGGVSEKTDTTSDERVSGRTDTRVSKNRRQCTPKSDSPPRSGIASRARVDQIDHVDHPPPTPSQARGSDEDVEFETFWLTYPPGCRAHTKRTAARRAFAAILAGKHRDGHKATAAEIIAGARLFAPTKPDPDYVPLAASWLNHARWLDKPQRRKSGGGSSQAVRDLCDPNWAGAGVRDTSESMDDLTARIIREGKCDAKALAAALRAHGVAPDDPRILRILRAGGGAPIAAIGTDALPS